MTILTFQKPDKVLMLEADNFFGKFKSCPLKPGYGTTVDDVLHHILLSSLEGFAITSIKTDGVDHEFGTIPGVIENVANIILNLKQVRFEHIVDGTEDEKASITVSGSEVFKAGDIGKQLIGFEILNPDLVICRLDPTASFQIELTINKGRDYVPADESRDPNVDIHVIAIDSVFTPIRSVKYPVENLRVEQKAGYKKSVLEVATDSSTHPKGALKEVAKILIHHFMLFSDEEIAIETADAEGNGEFDREVLHICRLLKGRLAGMDLSIRILNCLEAADVGTLSELIKFNKNDLLKFHSFGKKSLAELDGLLESLNLSFDMDITRYKLDKG